MIKKYSQKTVILNASDFKSREHWQSFVKYLDLPANTVEVEVKSEGVDYFTALNG